MEELARIVVLLLAVALLINLIQRGPQGVSEWARAKFLGRSTSLRQRGRAGARPSPARAR